MALSATPHASHIAELVRRTLAELLGLELAAIDVHTSFQALGLDSLRSVALAERLAAALERPVEGTIVWRYTTAARLAAFLSGEDTGEVAAAGRARADEPIAVVGMGCRLPGGISGPGALWSALLAGVDAIGEVPRARWDSARWYDPDVRAPGKMSTRRGGFLADDVAGFDAEFFRVAPAEARQMDPQQRLALEVALEALDDARLAAGGLSGSRTGVFVGAMWQEYGALAGAAADIEMHSAVGWDNSIIPARLAYVLGLRGPVMEVSTACSSSLVAVHLAMESLARGESELALAGGVSLMLSPRTTVAMTKFGAMSPGGRCRAFDAGADGYVRGEGCGFVVLRRLGDAIAAGDRIYAVLRGSAVNNDGASNGLTAPSPEAQVEVLRAAWARAGVAPGRVAYVEAHGTGTPLGDPIEASALGEVFAPGREQPLQIGSAKTNFGHLEPAAGVVGLMKAALSLHHGALAPSLHFERPNPHIDFAASRLEVVRTARGWPRGAERLAGVSSFGFGGTNAHVALAGAPGRVMRPLPLAADSEAGLRARINEARARLEAGADVEVVIREALARCPAQGAWRALVTGADADELAAALERLGEAPAAALRRAEPPRLALFFSGHGSQWIGMGRDLMLGPSEFRAALAACDAAIRPHAGFAVIEALARGSEQPARTGVIQPLIFALQVAYARTLAAWGVRPDVVFGQSIGEAAAAVVAGALTLEQGAALICGWSRTVEALAGGRGGMLVCELPLARAQALVAAELAGELAIAGRPSPEHVTLSGSAAAIERALASLAAAGARALRVDIDYACHCAGAMQPVVAPLVAALASVGASAAPTIAMWSTVDGGPVTAGQLDADYWARNTAAPMRLDAVLAALGDGGPLRIVEVGPHPVAARGFEGWLRAWDRALPDVWCTSLREQPGPERLLALASSLWRDGVALRWPVVLGTAGGADEPSPLPLVLSARGEAALAAQAERLAAQLERGGDRLVDVAFSLATTRTRHDVGAALVVDGREEAVAGLRALAAGRSHAAVSFGPRALAGGRGVALLFTGQGSQRAGMGQQLYAALPAFRAGFDRACAALDVWLDRPLRAQIFAAPGSEQARALDQTAITQPALFALEVALFEQWSAWGLRPAAVLGHSLGELSAAHVAGMLELDDAARLVCARARLMQGCRGGGAMASLAADEAEVVALLAGRAGQVTIAGLNGPGQTVISGDAEAVAAIVEAFAASGRRVQRLAVSHAFHSPHMDAMLDAFAAVVEGCRFQAPRLPIVGLVEGRVDAAAMLRPQYWVRQVREAVRFGDGVRAAAALGIDRFLECGPGGALAAMAAACVPETGVIVASLRRDQDERRSLLAAFAALDRAGVALDWQALLAEAAPRRVDLPTYPFQRQRFWHESAARAEGEPADTGAALWEAAAAGAVERFADLLELPPEARAQVAPLLPRLAAWRERSVAAASVSRWSYEERWQLAAPRGRAELRGRWLVLAPASAGWREAIAAALVAAGASVEVVAPDEALAGLRAALAEPIRGVLSLVASAAVGADAATGALLVDLAAIEALRAAGVAAPVWFVTAGAVAADDADDAARPEQALIWGLARALGLEQPERWGGTIDLPAAPGEAIGAALVAALAAEDGEREVALRPAGRFVRRLHRVAPEREAARGWTTSGTALISGGSGALARHLAAWLVERGAERVVLVSRRGEAAPGAAALRQALAPLGARVVLAACDVAEPAAVAALVAELRREGPPLRSVFHAAGALADRLLPNLEADDVRAVVRPKLHGAGALAAATGADALDAFVLFSSVVGCLGNEGQANYAAANAALDALAAQLRGQGRRALSVAWGPWDEGGMAAGHVGAGLRERGLVPMAPSAALSGLAEALRQGRSRVVADIDWALWAAAPASAGLRRALVEVAEAREALGRARAGGAASPVRATLQGLPADERLDWLRGVLAEEVAAVLGIADPRGVDPDRGFVDLGFDSMLAVEWSRRLHARVGVAAPKTLIFDQPNLRAAARWLLAELAPEAAAGGPVGPARAASEEPLAIVGVGLRMPGGAEDLEGLWRVLIEGRDTTRPIPRDRYDVDALFDPDPDADGKVYVRSASLLDDVAGFDAGLFGISPREAEPMDPQHRLLLESAWAALEHAGIRLAALRDSSTGVFVGAGPGEYGKYRKSEHPDTYAVTGGLPSFGAGRLAYHLGLQGPALAIDTACSSALVAVHLACASLRRGECELALAAGVQVIADPEALVSLCRSRSLAPDGRSKSFSADADGYGRGEGVGVLVLARLSDARARGLRVLGLIRGSAIGHDGASSGITAPNGTAQQKVLRAALADAGVAPDEVDYVECHGTGTRLGDPIEVQALGAVYGASRARPLGLGTVKSCIGHLESAAGIAGIAKILAALRHERLPASLRSAPASQHIDWERYPVTVIGEVTPWPREAGRARRAGVSSFGLSGTNAHVIVEEAPATEPAVESPGALGAGPLPVALSGRTDAALREQAGRWATWLEGQDVALAAVARTAATRAPLAARASVLAGDRAGLVAGLQALAAGREDPRVIRGRARPCGRPVFVFPGQGSQWAGMGAALYEQSPALRAAVDACDAAFRPLVGWSVAALLRGEPGPALDRIDVVQPALFTMMIGLAAAWRSLGVEPAAVLGHSQGEAAAAVVAGALSLEEGARVVAARSRLLRGAAGRGEMAVVELPVAEVEALLAGYGGALSVAAVNLPGSTVVSGDAAALADLLAGLDARDVFFGQLEADCASHSAQMDPLLPELRAELAGLRPRATGLGFYSTVTGSRLAGEALTGAYWARNLRETVRLDRALAQLDRDGFDVFIEVSPHPVLVMALADGERERVVVGSLARERGGREALLERLGELHARGLEVDWTPALGLGGAPVELPAYAFQRERFWLASGRAGVDVAAQGLRAGGHPWLGVEASLARAEGRMWSGRLALREQPWLADHRAYDRVLVPGTGHLDLALWAAQRVGARGVEELTLAEPLVLAADEGRRLQVVVEAAERGGWSLAVYSQADGADADAGWVQHGSGRLLAGDAPGEDARAGFEELAAWPPAATEAVALAGFYAGLADTGLQYGPAFQGLTELRRRGRVAFARVELPAAAGEDAFALHPALLDAALHALAGLRGELEPGAGVALPFAWSGVELYARCGGLLRVRVALEPGQDAGEERATLWASDGRGAPVLRVRELRLRRASAEQIRAAEQEGVARHLYRQTWAELPAPTGQAPGFTVIGGGALAAASAASGDAGWRVVDATGWDDPRAAAAEGLARVQQELCEAPGPGGLVFVVRPGSVAQAPLLGLLRVAQREHPQRRWRRIELERIDGEALARALAVEDEPELRVDAAGRVFAPRLVRAAAARRVEAGEASASWCTPGGTVLIVGGTGELGAAVAEHLVRAHGVERLVLTSRRGPQSPGVGELLARLVAAGARTEVVACDVTTPAGVAAALAVVDPAHPVSLVLHLAGVLDDGTIEDQTAERLARVMAPKVDGAQQLVARLGASAAYVLFSSVAVTLGTAGQAIYAATNSVLDALAEQLRARGIRATSLAWGLWEQAGVGMTAKLGAADLQRMRRQGVLPLAASEALALLDAALASDAATVVPARLDLAGLQRRADRGEAPPAMLRALVRPPRRRAEAGEAASLSARLAALAADAREAAVIGLVQREAAVVLGLGDAGAVPAELALRGHGLDSLMAVELRNRLAAETGLSLPATLAFDHPSPRAIAGQLLARMRLDVGAAPVQAPVQVSARVDEPIAIVAAACRLPGGIAGPEDYWSLLAEGRDAIEPFPARWRGHDVYDPDPDAPGKSYAREGGFLRDVERFDAGFFGISPREAVAMDPQQRLVLELAWEALERAGIVPAQLAGSKTGVYFGAMAGDYPSGQSDDLDALDGYYGTGSAGSVISGRVSYVLGLQGPSITVDTACSSSLVALHLACAALRQGECELALAGGVTVMSTPKLFVEFSRLKGMAVDGRCKSFSARSDGAGWAEGCGVVVLKPLRAALRDGDRIVALIRGSAVNQDGASQGLSAPNGPSQQRVIRDALAASRLAPADLDAVEAHGTGTTLGDPIEAGALAAEYGAGREPARPLRIGSSKSNLGHAQAAAGVAGVIKMALALEREVLPPTLHAAELSPHIAWEGSGLAVLREARAWPRQDGRPRRAGISSFGISGTNAHVIVEEAPAAAPTRARAGALGEGALPVVLSGRTDAALREQAGRWATWLKGQVDVELGDVARTAGLRRTAFEARAVVLAGDRAGLVEALGALAEGREDPRVLQGPARRRGKPVFVFPGQGSQWDGMGAALYGQSAAFRGEVDACDRALRPYLGWSVAALLRGEPEAGTPPTDRADAVQPALFAMMLGLAAAWRALGIEPAAVVGHSQGEVPAAVVAGALSLEDGARVVALRSQAVLACCGRGAMAVIERPVAEVEALIAGYGERVAIAAVNTASSTVVSGEAAAIDELVARLTAQALFCRRVKVDYASHSAQMDPLLERLAAGLAGVAPRAWTVPFYSTVEGRRLDGEALTGVYWARNLRATVRFDRALAQLEADGHGVFVEVSPHPLLALPLASGGDPARVVVGSLARDRGGREALLERLGELHVRGVEFDWARALGAGGPLVALPTYAFQGERYWLEHRRPALDVAARGLREGGHPWLGVETGLARGEGRLLCGRVALAEMPWLDDHRVYDRVVVPGTAQLELALWAGQRLGAPGVEELTLSEPLVLARDGGRRLQVVAEAAAGGGWTVEVYSQAEGAGADDGWVQHGSGRLAAGPGAIDAADARAFAELRAWPPAGAEDVALADFYAGLEATGLRYGAAFQGLCELRRRGEVAYGRVVLPAAATGAGYLLHPALTDAAVHGLAALRGAGEVAGGVPLPFAWSGVELHASSGGPLRVRIERAVGGDAAEERASLWVSDERGAPVLRVRELRLRRASAQQVRAAEQDDAQRHLYRMVEVAVEAPSTRAPAPQAVVIGGGRIAALLAAPTEAPRWQIVDATGWDEPLAAASEGLEQLQRHLEAAGPGAAGLVFVTAGGPGQAPLRGLVRVAQSEHPQLAVRLIELERVEAAGLARALAVADEPELRVDAGGRVLAPRLVRAGAAEGAAAPWFSPGGTVLLTGGTGELGAAVAEHLVAAHGVTHLVLSSRRGEAAPGVAELRERLAAAGAERVVVVACDVATREGAAAALASVDPARPLQAVVHLAGVLDDGLLTAQSRERLRGVLAPKLDGLARLRDLTEGTGVCFVLFSSAAGVLGTAGQATYAAANTALDALAERMRAQGTRATSLAWGFWEPSGVGMTAGLGAAEVQRLRRRGVLPLATREGLALFDAALARDEAVFVPIKLDLPGLQRRADRGEPAPAMLRALVRRARGQDAAASAPTSLREQLAALDEAGQAAALASLVQREAAVALGLGGAEAVPADQALRHRGLDSLMAVELRNRLASATGVTLPATLAFDYPTPQAIAGLLRARMQLTGRSLAAGADEGPEAALRWALGRLSAEQLQHSGLLARLVELARADAHDPSPPPQIEQRSVDDLNAELDELLGLN